ncbi:hypothetical protein KKA09_03215 [Patescibacteria group bacterium]|nr:hypothetical protein [Patescibacteria group bacterium]
MFTQDYQKISSNILGILPPRQKEIILRRFGLDSGQRETLDSIGQSFGVTRERVRQIEDIAFERLKQEAKEARRKELEKSFSYFEQYLEKQGGLKREDILLSELGGDRFQNHIYFLLTLGETFERFRENNNFYSFWVIDENLFQKAEGLLKTLVKIFEKEKRPLPEEEFFNTFKDEPSELFNSSFEIFKRIEKGPLNNFGLTDWPEIKPKGVKDRAFLILKKENRPLHFKEITNLASELEGTVCEKKEIYSQTVHNELIKNDMFVLIGKGIYALKEWGYRPGTVKDIIIDILKTANKPLPKEEIIEKVLKQRQVQENTIFLSLQDKNFFAGNEKGKYYLLKL